MDATVESQLAADLFTARLKHNTPGTYDFGYIDSSKYTGSLSYTTVDNSQGFWGFTPTSYNVGSNAGQSSIGAAIAYLAVIRLGPAARLGSRLGQYRLLRKIAEGAVRVDEVAVRDPAHRIAVEPGCTVRLSLGRKRHALLTR